MRRQEKRSANDWSRDKNAHDWSQENKNPKSSQSDRIFRFSIRDVQNGRNGTDALRLDCYSFGKMGFTDNFDPISSLKIDP